MDESQKSAQRQQQVHLEGGGRGKVKCRDWRNTHQQHRKQSAASVVLDCALRHCGPCRKDLVFLLLPCAVGRGGVYAHLMDADTNRPGAQSMTWSQSHGKVVEARARTHLLNIMLQPQVILLSFEVQSFFFLVVTDFKSCSTLA